MIKLLYKNVRDKSLKELAEFKAGCWLYAENPNKEEINHLVETYNLEEGHLMDALDPYEVPRIEREGNTIYIFARYAHADGSEIKTAPLLIVLDESFIATIAKSKVPALEKFLGQKVGFYTTQKTKLLIQFFMQINETYNKLINTISRKVRGHGIQLKKVNNKDIMEFVTFENILNDFLSALVPTSAILGNLLSAKHITQYEDDKDLVEDLFLSNGQLIEMSKSILKSIVNIREAHTTIMTNDLNKVMKLLTVITAILTIPTIVSGIFGMNVTLPLQSTPFAFGYIIGGTALVCLILFWILKKTKLL